MIIDNSAYDFDKKTTVMIYYPDTFVPRRYFRINEFSGLLN